MKKTFVDFETGWTVTRETSISPRSGAEVIEETITDPETGETHHCTRLAGYPRSTAQWVQQIAETREMMKQIDRERKQRLHQLYPELAGGAEVPAGPLGKIKLCFAQSFAMSDICLPEEDVVNRRHGKIIKAGWVIWYLFDSDEQGEYLDYYAAARMTSDRHVRVYADGRCERLPTIRELHLVSQDPEENARLEAEYFAENRRVAALLKAKGFGLVGDEPGSVLVNRFLHLQKPNE
jgi:hypothetical protein